MSGPSPSARPDFSAVPIPTITADASVDSVPGARKPLPLRRYLVDGTLVLSMCE